MKPPAKVSIGLPIYNGEQFAAQAIESILGQSLEDLELVISDNASTDATGDICRSFAVRRPPHPLRPPRQEHRRNPQLRAGLPHVRARGTILQMGGPRRPPRAAFS